MNQLHQMFCLLSGRGFIDESLLGGVIGKLVNPREGEFPVGRLRYNLFVVQRGKVVKQKAVLKTLDKPAAGVKEVDASPFIILIFAFFVVMRFVYRGFGEYQGYALFGALTGLGLFVRYMLFRQARKGNQ